MRTKIEVLEVSLLESAKYQA